MLAISACSEEDSGNVDSTGYLEVKSSDSLLRTDNRMMFFGNLLFTGKLLEIKDGDTLMYSEYRNGRKHGREMIFYPGGNIKEERYYDKGQKSGEHSLWWENGNLKFIYHYEKDELNGNMKAWNEPGQLTAEFNYVNGKEEGLQRAWFPNGEVQANYVAKNNRKYGITGVKNCQTYESALNGLRKGQR